MRGNDTNQRRSVTRWAIGMAVVLVLAILPTAGASLGSYGTLVGDSTSEQDLNGLPLLTPSSSVMFDDADSSGTFNCPSSNDCDPIYLNIGAGSTVSAGDVRLFHNSLSEGEQVKTTSDDFGNSLDGAAGNGLTFIDVYPHASCPTNNPPCDGLYNAGEPIFIDTAATGQLDSTDIRIISESSNQNSTGSSSYQKVSTSDSRIGNTTTALPGQVAVLDINGDNSYNIGDGVFLDIDGDGVVTPGDIQLTNPRSTSTRSDVKEVGDDFVVHSLDPMTNARFAWNDADGDTNVDDNEQIYIDTDGSGPVSRFDIRIGPVSGSSSTSTGAGEQVDAGDSELSGTVSLAGLADGQVKYVDNNGNSRVDNQDDVYLDVNNANSQVEAGDLVLAKGESSQAGTPGSRVSSGDSEIGDPLASPSAPTPFLHIVDFNQGGYGINDAFYLDWDDNDVVSPGDVRVSKGDSPMSSFGEFLDDGNQDANLCYRFDFSGYSVGWLDDGNPSVTNPDEGVYLSRAGGNSISPLDIRLSAGGSESAGTYVETGDVDQGQSLTLFGATPALQLYYHDSNGDSVFSLQQSSSGESDALYLDISAGGTSTNIAIGDVRMTDAATGSGSPGSKVLSGNDDVNLPISELTGFGLRGIDRDGDGTFGFDDEVYANIDEAREGSLRCPSPGDLRLTGSGGASSSGTSGGTGGGGGGGGGGTGTTETPPSVSISQPNSGTLLPVGETVTISGSASGGSDSLSEVTVRVDGNEIGTSSSSSWSFTWTPQTEGDHTITATVADTTGETRSATRTVTVGQDSDGDGVIDSNDECPERAGDQANGCPDEVRDEQARQDAREANQTAQEAKQAAEEASQTAREAKEAADAARDTAENTSKTIDQLIEQTNQTGGNGAPGPGALGVLLATLVAGAMTGAARRER